MTSAPASAVGWKTCAPMLWFTRSRPSRGATTEGQALAGSSAQKPCESESPRTSIVSRGAIGRMKVPSPLTRPSSQPLRHGSHTRTWRAGPMPGSGCRPPARERPERVRSTSRTSPRASGRMPSAEVGITGLRCRPSTSTDRPSCASGSPAPSTPARTLRVARGSASRRTSTATCELSVSNSSVMPDVQAAIWRNMPGYQAMQLVSERCWAGRTRQGRTQPWERPSTRTAP